MAAAAFLGGCAGPGRRQSDADAQLRQAAEAAEACSAHLHDLCGHLLRFYNARQRLPDTLDELAASVNDREAILCPVDGQPHLYNPAGWEVPRLGGRVFVLDPASLHDSLRLGVAIWGGPAQPLVTKIITLRPDEISAILGPQ